RNCAETQSQLLSITGRENRQRAFEYFYLEVLKVCMFYICLTCSCFLCLSCRLCVCVCVCVCVRVCVCACVCVCVCVHGDWVCIEEESELYLFLCVLDRK